MKLFCCRNPLKNGVHLLQEVKLLYGKHVTGKLELRDNMCKFRHPLLALMIRYFQVPYLLIENPRMCQITTIVLPSDRRVVNFPIFLGVLMYFVW